MGYSTATTKHVPNLLKTINQARRPVAPQVGSVRPVRQGKRCSLSFPNRVPLPDDDRPDFAAHVRRHIRFCRFANLLLRNCCSFGSPGRTESPTGYSHARSKTFSCRRLIATGGNSFKSGRELGGKNLRYPSPA